MSGSWTAGRLRVLVRDLLVASGVPEPHAERTAEILVLADVWGVASHGVLRLPHYLARLEAGGCRADAALAEESTTGGVAVYDGNAGLGHWQLWEAARRAVELCRTSGVAAVAIRNSSHCGALGAYVYPALEAGMIALVFTNGPAVMPPWNGHRAVLSTSPMAAGVPARPRPLVLDLATSAVARGTIAWRAQTGVELEPGWAFDVEGRPTTDPAAALRGMLTPMGGAKGYAVGLLVEALTGALVGPNLSEAVPDMFDRGDDATPQGIGHLVLTLRPDLFGSGGTGRNEDRFTALADAIVAAGGRTPGATRIAPRGRRRSAGRTGPGHPDPAHRVERPARHGAPRVTGRPSGPVHCPAPYRGGKPVVLDRRRRRGPAPTPPRGILARPVDQRECVRW
ncbi:Ldh family oxidoreductase [Prauserella rugosa]|uniref:(2R)-3-sulfolactate dehydrogenase (NADP+) n=1 Tax=Prauserella rugosa TaxID=43354 RepID=A0A660C940_9PSEU|nr:Ldh family oxidoreductase [Prauserella rugosa]TWH18333.1 (2R)-3-sulfolactate dehydrogenase (NADP+) [Prauserella rugosa]